MSQNKGRGVRLAFNSPAVLGFAGIGPNSAAKCLSRAAPVGVQSSPRIAPP